MAKNLTVFTCNDHAGYYPVGAASVVVAEDERKARAMLSEQLKSMGINGEDFTLEPLDVTNSHVKVLLDGDY